MVNQENRRQGNPFRLSAKGEHIPTVQTVCVQKFYLNDFLLINEDLTGEDYRNREF